MLQPAPNPSFDHALLALADPTRRAILDQLGDGGEKRVTELAAPFAISLNSVSKHIKILERGGLIRRRRAGREHLLSANPGSLDEAAAWIAQRRRFWNARLDQLQAILEAEAAPKEEKNNDRST